MSTPAYVHLEIVGTKKRKGLWDIQIVISGFKKLPDLKQLEDELNADTLTATVTATGQSTL